MSTRTPNTHGGQRQDRDAAQAQGEGRLGMVNAATFDKSDYLVAEDLRFLDAWKPALFLLASANDEAREEVKVLFEKTHRTLLRAWRRALDTNHNNKCSWKEFQDGCKKVGYTGDAAGAWRAFDVDLSGSISLAELDEGAYKTLARFRKWAVQEFGSVVEAFRVFDYEGDGRLSLQEFAKALRTFDYPDREVVALFHSLRSAEAHQKEVCLLLKEVMFLDTWLEDPFLDKLEEKADKRARERDRRRVLPEKARQEKAAPEASVWTPIDRAGPVRGSFIHCPKPKQFSGADRICWSELPDMNLASPKTNRPPSRGVGAAWCNLCNSRGPCRHIWPAKRKKKLNLRQQQSRRSLKDSSPRRGHSACSFHDSLSPLPSTTPEVWPVTLRTRSANATHSPPPSRPHTSCELSRPGTSCDVVETSSPFRSRQLSSTDSPLPDGPAMSDIFSWQATPQRPGSRCMQAEQVQVLAIRKYPLGSLGPPGAVFPAASRPASTISASPSPPPSGPLVPVLEKLRTGDA
eukprot:TRINITY_DN3652_c0_g1_i4.p1 TRINITY_DN3652_c0_g1~~TRINITY_DN3652_c0_g1_i4.p1  ORF type:complete len:518 (-),score=98.91 TRINITY_DN3652_c0_g1_i4:129-1682(-)